MQRILLLGGSGQLGTALHRVFADAAVHAPSHAAFDIATSSPDSLFAGRRYDILINCAAFLNVDACEREPERAFTTNAIAVDRLAAACADRDIAFMTVSTDYVFDGTSHRAYRENDIPNPRTVYGASKLAGEHFARRHGTKHYIVRTSGLFGTTIASNKGYTLIEKLLAQAERGEPGRVVADMIFSPSFAPHAARVIHDLIQAKAYGTHHVTNAGSCSWHAFVQTAFNKARLPDARLEPITYASFGSATPRPMHSPLENTTLASLGIPPMPPWEQALDEFLAARATL